MTPGCRFRSAGSALGGIQRPRLFPGHVVTGLNDQHAHMTVPADSPLEVGDMVRFDIPTLAPIFDNWQPFFVVNDDYTVVDVLRTFF